MWRHRMHIISAGSDQALALFNTVQMRYQL